MVEGTSRERVEKGFAMEVGKCVIQKKRSEQWYIIENEKLVCMAVTAGKPRKHAAHGQSHSAPLTLLHRVQVESKIRLTKELVPPWQLLFLSSFLISFVFACILASMLLGIFAYKRHEPKVNE